MSGKLLRRLSLFAVLACLGTGVAGAQMQNPNHERGFSPEKAFQVGDLDHVNLFNGNLVITIPVGQSFPLDGGLSYGLTLSYNVVSWRFDEICPQGDSRCYNSAKPIVDDNAGFGWMLGLGRLKKPLTLLNPSTQWIYVGADGADHVFYPTLHEGDANQTGVSFTRDGSYLRMKTVGGFQEIELPDGTVHKLHATTGELLQIRSRLMNGALPAAYLNVTPVYSGGSLIRWDLADSAGRTHKVNFANFSVDGKTTPLVTSVVLAGFGGSTVTYGFTYSPGTVKRPPQHDYATVSTDASVRFLTQIDLPGSQTYKMGPGLFNGQGQIPWLELPTKGTLEWSFGTYSFPRRLRPKESPSHPDPSADPYDRSLGVTQRRLKIGSTVVGQWTYSQFLDTANSRTEMTDPLNNKWKHHFRADPEDPAHGLPYTSVVNDGAGRFLSTEVVAAGTSTPVRSTFVRYEWDKQPLPDPLKQDNPGDVNRRPASEKTVYHDDGNKFAEVSHSQFDGLGHYRTSVTSGTFAAADARTSKTNFNPARGNYLHLGIGTGHTFTMLPASSPWVLGTYDFQSETEGGVTATRDSCFEASTGFLLRERVRKSASAGSTDVLRVHTRNAVGNRIREQHYGGDTQALGTGALCSLTLPSVDQVRIEHTYSAGVPATSDYRTSSGATLSFKHLDLTVDAKTGLASASRDTTGLATSYEYDALGRVTWVKPATGQGGWTEYVYTQATSTTALAKVKVNQRANGSKTATILSESEILYDAFGRVWREKKRLPGSVWSTTETGYNALGWKTYVTETDSATSPVQRTQFLSFDPFGRPKTIRPADGSVHDVTFSYSGVRVVTRTAKLATSRDAGTGVVTETSVKTRELYDRQGRLWRVWEDDGGANAALTEYLYDVGNRLKTVSMTRGAVSQTRAFTYDQRGFLTSERHPEKGTSGNGTVSYLSYDSRGKASRKIDGPQDLTFAFDRAERLTQVRETGGALRVLEARTYGTSTSTSDRSLGKLKTATRNNYHERFGVNFPSVSTYTYGGRDGRVSSLLHTINTSDSYTQTFVWNELGNLASQTYPTCNHCPVGTVPSRTVSYTYSQGFLTAVPNWATSITYHPNGLVNQITHVNGVVSTQANDPNRMKRPASITVTKSTSTLFATGAYAYDGSGNVSKIGSDYYLYDTLGRLKEGTALQAGSSNRQTYQYDGFGNLTSTTSWVNGSGTTRTNSVVGTTNRLSAAGYDAAGNQTTWGTYAYTWDLMGLMKAYQGSGNDWAYAYDADDERMFVYNVVTGQSTFRIRGLDGKVLREVKLTGSTWSWGKDWIYRDGQLLATAAPGSVVRYAHADHLGSPRLFTDATGVAKERFHYYPFGEQAGTAPTAPEALRFTGHERDSGASTGTADDLDYMHARYYHPQLGRFLSVDPARESGRSQQPITWNRYTYAIDSPLKHVDPDGQEAVIFIVAPSSVGDPKGLVGHAAMAVISEGTRAGVSQFGAESLDRGAGAFIQGYHAKGRDVTMYVLKTTPEQDSQMVAFMQKNSDGGIDTSQSIAFQNCTTACVNVLQAGGVVEPSQNPGSGIITFGLDNPKALQRSLESGKLSKLVSAVIVLPSTDDADDERFQ